MEWDLMIKKELTFSSVTVSAARLGGDILLAVQGGEKPHIGCTVQAVPRESLTGDGSISATSSVMNLSGHKDEALCRSLAEQVCKKTAAVVVCTGGFHVDGITKEQIGEVTRAVADIGTVVSEKLL